MSLREIIVPLKSLLIDEKFLPAALAMVLKAKKSIYISTFKAEITIKPRGKKLMAFFLALALKAREGVDVQLLINKPANGKYIPISNNYAINWLQNNKIQVRCLPEKRICHSKIILVDKEIAILGSHNLSVRSCHNNFEVSFTLCHAPQIHELTDVFERIWENSQRA